MNVLDVANEVVDQLPHFTRRNNACVLGTRLFVVKAREQGILCRPVPFNVMAMNREAYELMAEGVPVPQWPATAWSVGVLGDTPAGALTSVHGGYFWHLAVEAVYGEVRSL